MLCRFRYFILSSSPSIEELYIFFLINRYIDTPLLYIIEI
nr:MAG TPA: hypothetical protein [Bacteriophage sp.]